MRRAAAMAAMVLALGAAGSAAPAPAAQGDAPPDPCAAAAACLILPEGQRVPFRRLPWPRDQAAPPLPPLPPAARQAARPVATDLSRVVSFSIPALPAEVGLRAFALQAPLRVRTTECVEPGLTTAAVFGEMTRAEALARLLEGSGLALLGPDGGGGLILATPIPKRFLGIADTGVARGCRPFDAGGPVLHIPLPFRPPATAGPGGP